MTNKEVFGSHSSVLLIAAVFSLIATVVNSQNLDGARTDLGGFSSAFSNSDVATLCSITVYKDVCIQTLGPILNGSVDPKDAIHAAFESSSTEIAAAIKLAKNVSQGATDEFNKNAFKDCDKLLQDAADELLAAMTVSHDLAERIHDIGIWLSAVITYTETCIDGITQPELQSTMRSGLDIAAKVTSNAIQIVDALVSLFKNFHLPSILNITGSGRRLLSDGNGMLPSWFAANDRKLLAAQSQGQVKPDAVVAKDGSGNFQTINAAINAIPKKFPGRYVIYVKAGTYKETVSITKDKPQIFMYGDGPRKTVVSGSLNNVDGVTTMNTATFAVMSAGFICKSMGFTNTAGPQKHQAVALRVQADKAAFLNCRMDAYQDTLYVHALRQFYRNCIISGTIDFIFGDAAAVLQNCRIILRRPMDNQQNTVTAQGRTKPTTKSGLVIHNCRIVPDARLSPDRLKIPSYLGRPWKAYARTVVMESTIDDVIRPEGWMPWAGKSFEKTLYYAEYANRGASAGTNGRVKWPGYHVINKQTAEQFTVDKFIQGYDWIKDTGITYFPAFATKKQSALF